MLAAEVEGPEGDAGAAGVLIPSTELQSTSSRGWFGRGLI